MVMNLKEGDRYVVNHDEGLTAVDFGGHVSLVEKEGAGMAERRSGTGQAQQKGWSISCRWTAEWRSEEQRRGCVTAGVAARKEALAVGSAGGGA
ncbi:hypothetical protein BHE74_00025101 [Ensete ventricosum]|nr:hypothetical protein BHE74_00025101 [Ensete ventricosum]